MEMNKTNMIPEDELVAVAGGSDAKEGGYIVGSDGNTYGMVYRTDECCPKFICKRCSSSGYEHHARCRLSEAIRNTCEACSYYDSVSPMCGACRATGKPKG